MSVSPIFAQIISSGYGALSILTLIGCPLCAISNLLPLLAHVMKFLTLSENYLGLSSLIVDLAILESRVTKKTGFC